MRLGAPSLRSGPMAAGSSLPLRRSRTPCARSSSLRPWAASILLLVALWTVAGAPAALAAPVDEPLSRSAERWVRHTLADLSLEEKAAQMVMPRAFSRFQNPRSEGHARLLAEVRDRHVGGVAVFASELETLPRLINDLQQASELPLLVASDLERSLAFRLRRGTVPLPYAMALGATRSDEAARFAGEVTAREGRALGIHWAFAPVADVNNNPENPIINLRSYGEDPDLVARMTAAFVRGAHGEGPLSEVAGTSSGRSEVGGTSVHILTTAKHFPGHGDTDTDSHHSLPVVTAGPEHLRQVELMPFAAAIEAGVDSVMIGHISVPALDASGAAASLSAPITTDLLRNEMGFDGLIVTDAIDMTGIRPAWVGEATVRAVQAGVDVVLMPPDSRVAIQALVRAVDEGQLTEARLDRSVRRILETKARLGLHRQRLTQPAAIGRSVSRPEDVERSLDIARQSITVVRNEDGILPLHAEEPIRLLHVVLSSRLNDSTIRGLPEAELRRRRIDATTYRLGPEISSATVDTIVATGAARTHILVSAFARVSSTGGDLSPSQVELLQRLQATSVPTILVSYDSPYLLAQVPDVPAYVCTYGAADSSQRAGIGALFGEFAITGKLPVTLSETYPFGHGLEIAQRPMTLAASTPEKAGFSAAGLREVDRVLDRFVADGAFPGGVLAVGHQGALAYLHPFGHLTYDNDSPPVVADTLYDLASVTKVLATTTMAMILVDEGLLDLDKPVQDFLPLFQGDGKEKVTVWNILTHSSGLPSGGPLYQEAKGKKAFVERIEAMDLEYEPGSKAVYSDYGMILMGEIVERVAGQTLDTFLEDRVYGPLGMDDTLYRPGPNLLPRIAPTEVDAWRGRLVHGEVHDENAFAMGGVAPHAGLFSTAGDLARYAQMILNGGVLEHQRIFSRPTVELFTKRVDLPDSSRAIGWDTKSAEKSSAGRFFSPNSFGHLGYTGTSMWIDPERRLFVILLTNRVHPTRDNILIRKARPAVADAVVEALVKP